MADLIDRQALAEKKFQDVQCKGFGDNAAYRQGWNDAIDAIIENEPSADVQREKTAAWVGIDEFPHEDWECSACGYIYNGDEPTRYCPGCGARMESEEK